MRGTSTLSLDKFGGDLMEVDYIKVGDCVELMQELPDKSIDLVITSPPYNMTKRKGGYADTGKYDVYFDWKPEKEYIDWITCVFDSFNRILADNGVVLFNFSYSIENPSLPYKLVSNIENNTDFTIVDTIIWKKKNGIPFPANSRRLSRIWEFIFVFVKKKSIGTFNTNRNVKNNNSKTGQKYYDVVYNMIEAKNNDGKCEFNQAAFSSDLVSQLINIYSKKETDVILDPFMGTGTTAIGCIKTNRKYIGFELSENQFNYSLDRIKNFKDTT